ncbi:hypothetical protein KP509_10G012700 [Ceratopteris richardii]|nr:hypothetical protein KP509_10G012700 [Ceratopteris richardii]
MDHWNDAFWRSDQPGAMQVVNMESVGDYSCHLPSSDEYSHTSCYQGAVPSYAVQASGVEDVQAAIRFANHYNLRLTIKSTGHDSMGRSTAPFSLNIWMHYLKGVEFHDSFRPEGCSADVETSAAVTAEAGVQWFEIYEKADLGNRTVVGGMSGSVSAPGGFLQGGGHSPLSPFRGLAADNVLELKVVTPDGNMKVANPCQHTDLFWALRGGGGGTYGVVMSATFATFPALQNPVGVRLLATANTNSSFQSLLARFVELQASLSDAGFWAGYSYISFNSIGASYLLPYISSGVDPKTAAESAFEPLKNFIDAHEDELSLGIRYDTFQSFRAWRNFQYNCDEGDKSTCTDSTGRYLAIASRLLPKDLLKDDADAVAEAFMQILSDGVDQIIGHLVAGRAVSRNKGYDNAVNPAWRKALWHVIVISRWTSEEACAATETSRRSVVTEANGLLRSLTPGSGCYLNEADYNEPDWQFSFFGTNYDRLQAIKQQVDPHGLFHCRNCVESMPLQSQVSCGTWI